MAEQKKSGVDADDFINLLNRLRGGEAPPQATNDGPLTKGMWVGGADGGPHGLDAGLDGIMRGLFSANPTSGERHSVEGGAGEAAPDLMGRLVSRILSGERSKPERDAYYQAIAQGDIARKQRAVKASQAGATAGGGEEGGWRASYTSRSPDQYFGSGADKPRTSNQREQAARTTKKKG